MKELSIVTYIKIHGLDKTIIDFDLKCKEYDDKILLKYNQIDSDMSKEEVQDCRGLILERETWKVMSLAFRKFFNSAEINAAKIKYPLAFIYEKCDGSLIQVYWDWNQGKWFAGTSGMAEAEGEVNEKPNTTFAKLFWDTMKTYEWFDINNLVKGRTYAFELMTPYNIVVCPHPKSTVALLGIRNLETLEEFAHVDLVRVGRELGVGIPKRFDLNPKNADDLIATFEGMPYTEEGYVVWDGTDRIKIKNPAYLAAHHLKSKTGAHHIMTIVKTNEIEEYGATFPERLEEMNVIKIKYDELILDLEGLWKLLKKHVPKEDNADENKKYAMRLFKVLGSNSHLKEFQGLFFSLKDERVDNVKDYIFNYDNKRLYERFTK
jgi:hypothetical protein